MWFIALLACSSSPVNPCKDDADVLVQDDTEALTCAQAKIPTRYIRVLSGRPLPGGSTATGIATTKQRFLADPVGTREWLAGLRSTARQIELTPGLKGAELRSSAVWTAISDSGPIGTKDKALWNILEPALSVYARDDKEKLALTEIDMEGWVMYASLCHEAQGDGVLTVSIAQRVNIYQMQKDRFEAANRDEMVAMSSLGVVWNQVRDKWQAASYEKQQAWMADAPRPARTRGTSLGYLETVIEGDLPGHAAALHDHFGPLHFRDGPGYFTGEP